MFDRKSDYALNKKDPEAIVCKSVSGVHIRLTRVDFSSDEEFQRWKDWSDEDYHAAEKKEHIHADHTASLYKVSEIVVAVQSPDDVLMDEYDQQEQERLLHQLAIGLDSCLTPAQRRRLRLYYVEGLTVRQIAEKEGVRHQNVTKRITQAKNILKNFLQRGVPNHPKNSGK